MFKTFIVQAILILIVHNQIIKESELNITVSLQQEFVPLDQLDYSAQGFISSDSKTIDFCESSWAIAAAYLYEYTLRLNRYTGLVS